MTKTESWTCDKCGGPIDNTYYDATLQQVTITIVDNYGTGTSEQRPFVRTLMFDYHKKCLPKYGGND